MGSQRIQVSSRQRCGWYDASAAKRISGVDLMRTKILLICIALCVACIIVTAAEFQDGSQDRLYSAIRANDLRQIKALLDGGVSANAEGPDGITPLMVAAEAGSLDAMKLLVERHADVNAKNTYGST